MSAKVTYPTRKLFDADKRTQLKYTPAASTDLRARFRELMDAAKKPLPAVTLVRKNQK